MDYTKILSALRRVKDALEKKIDAVNTSVSGLPNTLDTQFTAVKNDIAGVKTDVAGVRGGVDTNLQHLTELLSKGTVKSVQRGVVQWASTVNWCGQEVTVNLAQVNPSKTIVLLQASNGKVDGKGHYVAQASLASLSATSMQLNVSVFYNADPYAPNSTIYASWQVIEFY